MDRVGIVGYCQVKPCLNYDMDRYELIFRAVRGAIDGAGLKVKDITTTISATNDFYDGRTISNCLTEEAGAAYMKDESKVEMDGAYAVLYGLMRALSGNHKLVCVWGESQPSTFPYLSTTLQSTDPTFERQMEIINELTAGAFQMRSYMNKYNVSVEDIAKVAVKNNKNAAKNPLALPESMKADCTIQDVLKANMMSSPITELMYPKLCESASCILLAPEEHALKITDHPVWISGVGYSQETYYLGERDLSTSLSMQNAAKMAFGEAGIKDPKKQIKFAELHELFSHQEYILSEAIGLCDKGKGSSMSTGINGELPVNPSGGVWSGNTPCCAGLNRIIEAAKQIRGEAKGHQVANVDCAIASGQFGFCNQNNILYVLKGGLK